MKMAINELYERANLLQDTLDTAHKHPSLITEVLENAVQERPFFAFVDRISSHDSPPAFYHSYLEVIHKQNLQGRRNSAIFPSTTSNVMTSKCSNQCCTSHNTSTALISENQLSIRPNMFGRNCALPNRTIKFRKTNPVGKNGKVVLCRECGSPENFIRDCPVAKRAALVNIALDGSLDIGESPTDLHINKILDVYQNQQDDVWMAISEKMENTNENTDQTTSTSPTIYTQLKKLSYQHEYFKGINTQSPKLIVN